MTDVAALAPNLERREDGIWYASGTEPVSYPEEGHQQFFDVEGRSFWFQHRNRCIAAAVANHPPAQGEAIFDVGGGNGFVAMGLQEAGHAVVVVEPGPVGARNAKSRGIDDVVCATTRSAGFLSDSLPAIGAFDVIEHVEDDTGFLEEMRGLLKPGGYLYATVPAYHWLWSHEDEIAGHFRRYDLVGICGVFEHAGFSVEQATYFFRPLPFPILAARALPYRMGLAPKQAEQERIEKDHGTDQGVLVRWMMKLLSREVDLISQDKPMRFGGSCLVVGRTDR